MDKRIVCVIPARLHSSRFPKKILANLMGKPLLKWVWEAACRVPLFDAVHIALDNIETERVVATWGASYYPTSPLCRSGSERLSELITTHNIPGDVFVNWQADEPMVSERMIYDLLQTVHSDPADVWTLQRATTDRTLVQSPHIVKVVTNREGYALYFSRSPIPFDRDHVQPIYHKHIGLYAYSRATLIKLRSWTPSLLAHSEQLEQLDFLYYGLRVRLHNTNEEAIGVDLPEHLEQIQGKI